MRRTYVIAGGYTAGHITPGLAVAAEFRARRPDLDLLFIGSAGGVEGRLVREAGLPFLPLPAAPWANRGPVARARAIAVLPIGFAVARRHLLRSGALGLLSLGSFAAVGPALAAVSLGLPLTILEANAEFGLAHRVLRRFARQVLVSGLFGADAAGGPRPAPVRVALPLRAELHALRTHAADPPSGELRLLVLGGSLGDAFLNARVPGLVRRLAQAGRPVRVTHQCGAGVEPQVIRDRYAAAGVPALVEAFLDPIAPVLAAAQFVITAAGAVTLHEIAAAGVPALVVPLSTGAARHQYANAAAFAAATGALQQTEETWEDAPVAAAIGELVAQPAAWRAQRDRLRAFATGTGARDVLRCLEEQLPPAPRPA